jgi:hypothetical protein
MNASVIMSKVQLVGPNEMGLTYREIDGVFKLYDECTVALDYINEPNCEVRMFLGRVLADIDGYYPDDAVNRPTASAVDVYLLYAGFDVDDAHMVPVNRDLFYAFRFAARTIECADSSMYVYNVVRYTTDKECQVAIFIREPSQGGSL